MMNGTALVDLDCGHVVGRPVSIDNIGFFFVVALLLLAAGDFD